MISRSRRSRRHPSTFGLSGLIVLIVLATAIPVGAHAPDPVISSTLFGQDQSLAFRWRAGSEPPTIMRTAIRAAATDSNESRASRAATFVYDAAGASLIGYGTGTCGVNGIGCFTRSAPTSFTMWLREHGRVYDWGTLRWCQMQSTPTNGCYDAETIALDEFGHVEVLGHHLNYADGSDYTDAVVQTYSRTRPAAGYNMHAYGVCDTATLQIKYDLPGASSLYSKCLDLVTGLTLGANDTSIAFGSTVTLTSVLRVATNTAYGRLSANPVSGRTVRLQRRYPGETSWTAAVTMTPTSPTGSYVASQRLYTTTDYRAVFSTPTSEGLRGDTSPTIRVTVAACTFNCPLPIISQ